MAQSNLLQQAIAAAHAGHELTARDLFQQVVECEPENEVAWMWLTGLLDDLDEQIHACEMVMQINPENLITRRYLDQLRLVKQKTWDEENQQVADQLPQVQEMMRAGKRDHALQLTRQLLQQNGHSGAPVWRLLAELSPDLNEQIRALEQVVVLEPKDAQAQQRLQHLRHFQKNPLELAAMYEEQGEIDKAIATYSVAAASLTSSQEWDRVYWKIATLENLRQEKIAHISPTLSVARLTTGPALLYLFLTLVQVGINPFSDAQILPLLCFGFFWVLAGSFMVALSSVRSRHRLWFILFKDVGSGGSPAARMAMAFAGWMLVLVPHLMLLWTAYSRLSNSIP